MIFTEISRKITISHENHQKSDFGTSKYLRNLLVSLMFSAPGPPGHHFYLKVPIFTAFHQNGGEIPIFHLQTAFRGVKSQSAGENNKRDTGAGARAKRKKESRGQRTVSNIICLTKKRQRFIYSYWNILKGHAISNFNFFF